MYVPKHFQVEDKDTLFQFIETHSFGVIVSSDGAISSATHMPFC
jgi:transcriptional regulator